MRSLRFAINYIGINHWSLLWELFWALLPSRICHWVWLPYVRLTSMMVHGLTARKILDLFIVFTTNWQRKIALYFLHFQWLCYSPNFDCNCGHILVWFQSISYSKQTAIFSVSHWLNQLLFSSYLLSLSQATLQLRFVDSYSCYLQSVCIFHHSTAEQQCSLHC